MVVLSALLVTWLIMGESSPLYNYFVWHVGLPNTWAMTTVIPFIFSAVVTNNPHSPSMVIFIFALIIQWFLVGFLSYLFRCRDYLAVEEEMTKLVSPPTGAKQALATDSD